MEFMPAKKLGFGLMRLPRINPDDSASIDIEQLTQMVDAFMEQGFSYFDTAWMYQSFASESAVREVLTSRYPRESFTLATKLHNGYFDSLEGRDEVFNAQLEKTGAGYFDYYLAHGIEASSLPHFEKYDVFSWMLEKRDQGLIRHAGFSYHDGPELLDKILTKHPEMEFVQLQINYLDWDSPWVQSRACYEVARAHGKPIIVMEPVKGGTLAELPPQADALLREREPDASSASWAVRFAASLPGVMCVLSGMSSLEQMQDNTSFMADFKPLTQEEQELCFRVAEIINQEEAIACTSCHYCTDGCPMNICIPEYFSLYNEDMRENLGKKGWTINYTNYEKLAEDRGRASECIACGQCEDMCPQHLPIIETLEKVATHYER